MFLYREGDVKSKYPEEQCKLAKMMVILAEV
jgi:hypothetical protein